MSIWYVLNRSSSAARLSRTIVVVLDNVTIGRKDNEPQSRIKQRLRYLDATWILKNPYNTLMALAVDPNLDKKLADPVSGKKLYTPGTLSTVVDSLTSNCSLCNTSTGGIDRTKGRWDKGWATRSKHSQWIHIWDSLVSESCAPSQLSQIGPLLHLTANGGFATIKSAYTSLIDCCLGVTTQ